MGGEVPIMDRMDAFVEGATMGFTLGLVIGAGIVALAATFMLWWACQ